MIATTPDDHDRMEMQMLMRQARRLERDKHRDPLDPEKLDDEGEALLASIYEELGTP